MTYMPEIGGLFSVIFPATRDIFLYKIFRIIIFDLMCSKFLPR